VADFTSTNASREPSPVARWKSARPWSGERGFPGDLAGPLELREVTAVERAGE